MSHVETVCYMFFLPPLFCQRTKIEYLQMWVWPQVPLGAPPPHPLAPQDPSPPHQPRPPPPGALQKEPRGMGGRGRGQEGKGFGLRAGSSNYNGGWGGGPSKHQLGPDPHLGLLTRRAKPCFSKPCFSREFLHPLRCSTRTRSGSKTARFPTPLSLPGARVAKVLVQMLLRAVEAEKQGLKNRVWPPLEEFPRFGRNISAKIF